MKFITLITLSLLPASALAAGPSLDDVISRLEMLPLYEAKVDLTVAMPQLPNDVHYSVTLTEVDEPADSLLGSQYLIDWRLNDPDRNFAGFSAYYAGNHYRFNGDRLTEYHFSDAPESFIPAVAGLNSAPGVHRSAQFVELLPSQIAANLRSIASDPQYQLSFRPDTIVDGLPRLAVVYTRQLSGETVQEAELVFDPETLLPLSQEFENNPGSLSEQSLYVKYVSSSFEPALPEISESSLAEAYPEAFTLLRQSNFRIENLPGMKLPAFAIPTLTGERYTRHADDPMGAPTILALLDIDTGFSPDVVADVRSAADQLPFTPKVIFAFLDNHIDRVEAITGAQRVGEDILINAAPLVRDCGAATLPAVILVGADGTVADVQIGYNQNLSSNVIQKMALLAR